MLFLRKDEDGQSMVEYSLILVSIAILVMAVLALLGPLTNGMYQDIMNALSAVIN